jgi:putative nucleotidyltransferase with HDIG domain
MPEQPPSRSDDPNHPYAGRWVARLKGRTIGQGGTPEQARQAAKASRFKEKPEITFMPTNNSLTFSPLLDQVQDILKKEKDVYLVGGAVRDALLGLASKDLDFALPGDALRTARRVANKMGGSYYRLDDEHQAGRVVLNLDDGQYYVLDFAKFRGDTLYADLRGRDFSINAIAVALQQPQQLLDPLAGMADLQAKKLNMCSPSSLQDDPLRILRAVRFAANLDLKIEPKTRRAMRAAVESLPGVSPERQRDELFRILASPRPAASLRALDILGALEKVLPEIASLKGVEQSAPHVYDVWEHTLQTVSYLEKILAALDTEYDPDTAAELHTALVVLRLGRYREQISQHLSLRLNRERPLRPLVFLAALYHDIAKPLTRSVEEDGRIRFLDHENQGAPITSRRASKLRLSGEERHHLTAIVRNHMRPRNLAHEVRPPSRRAIYRFFRDTGQAGVDARRR